MKEIKFRAIIPEHNINKIFWLEDLIKPLFSTREFIIPWLLNGNKPDRFTQKKDKNGKEVYEGDIVIPAPNEWDEPPLTIEFNEGCFIISRLHTLNKTFWELGYQLEVIGNIYENPELLENK